MVGSHTKVKVVKNKVSPPFKTAEFDIMFGEGISREGDILDLAAGVNVVVKSGAWFSYNNQKIGQGRENAKKYLRENPEVREEIEQKVRAHYGLGAEQTEEGQETAEKENKSEKNSKKTEENTSKDKTDAPKEAEAELAEELEETADSVNGADLS